MIFRRKVAQRTQMLHDGGDLPDKSSMPNPAAPPNPDSPDDDDTLSGDDELISEFDDVLPPKPPPSSALKPEARPPRFADQIPETERVVIQKVVEKVELKPDRPIPIPPSDVKDDLQTAPVGKLDALLDANARIRDRIVLGLAFLPILICSLLVAANAVDTPHGEDWRQVALLEQLHAGKLEAAHLLESRDGSRTPIPQAVGLFLARTAESNLTSGIWLNFGVLGATALGILILLGRTARKGLKLGLLFLSANLILFSPMHFQQLLTAGELGLVLAIGGLVWSNVFATTKLPWPLRLIFCVICGMIGTFSHAVGLAIWPSVLLLALGVKGLGKLSGKIAFSIIWILLGAATMVIYFGPSSAQQLQDADAQSAVGEWFALVAQVMGPVWTFKDADKFVILIGLVLSCGLAASVFYWISATTMRGRGEIWNRCLPWLGLGVSGLIGTAIFSSVSSNPLGAETAMAAAPVLLSLVVVFVIFRTDSAEVAPDNFLNRNGLIMWAVVIGAFMAHQSALWVYGIGEMRESKSERLRADVQLRLASVLDIADPQLRSRSQFLAAAGYRPAFDSAALNQFELADERLTKTFAIVTGTSVDDDEKFVIGGASKLPVSPVRGADAVLAVKGGKIVAAAELLDAKSWRLQLTEEQMPAEIWLIDGARSMAMQTSIRVQKRGFWEMIE